MTSIGIVCGYDLHADLDSYVNAVAGRLEQESLDTVILAGGYTSPGQYHSEAWVMAAALRARMPSLDLMLEERSLTTLDNLIFADELARNRFGKISDFVIYCDIAHRTKVRLLAKMLLGAPAAIRALPREVPLRVRLFEPFSIVIEALGAKFGGVQRLVRRTAVRLKGLTSEHRHTVLRAALSASFPLRRSGRSGTKPAPPAAPVLPPS